MNRDDYEEFCKVNEIFDYKINDDGSIDVQGNVFLFSIQTLKLPIKFNKVSGFFDCGSIFLTTLENCPNYIGEDFICTYNKLTSLDYFPTYVGNSFFTFIKHYLPNVLRGMILQNVKMLLETYILLVYGNFDEIYYNTHKNIYTNIRVMQKI